MVKNCELCESPARTYCDSDQASLCWTCDSNVHSVNFLVARHSRSLLCAGCQSLTPWSASGASLSPATVSLCDKCCAAAAASAAERREREFGVADELDFDEDEDEDEDEDDTEGEEEEDGENQVVPSSATPPPPPSPPLTPPETSCFISDDEFSDLTYSSRSDSMNRNRESSSDLPFQDNNRRSISRWPVITPAVGTAGRENLRIGSGITRRLRDN